MNGRLPTTARVATTRINQNRFADARLCISTRFVFLTRYRAVTVRKRGGGPVWTRYRSRLRHNQRNLDTYTGGEAWALLRNRQTSDSADVTKAIETLQP